MAILGLTNYGKCKPYLSYKIGVAEWMNVFWDLDVSVLAHTSEKLLF